MPYTEFDFSYEREAEIKREERENYAKRKGFYAADGVYRTHPYYMGRPVPQFHYAPWPPYDPDNPKVDPVVKEAFEIIGDLLFNRDMWNPMNIVATLGLFCQRLPDRDTLGEHYSRIKDIYVKYGRCMGMPKQWCHDVWANVRGGYSE